MPNGLELTLISSSSSTNDSTSRQAIGELDGIQNTSFEAAAQNAQLRRSAYVEGYADMLQELQTKSNPARTQRSLSFVQTKLTKSGCVSALQRPEDGARCWQKAVVVK